MVVMSKGRQINFTSNNATHYYLIDLLSLKVYQGWQKRSGCSGFGQISFSQEKNESPFLQIVSTKQMF